MDTPGNVLILRGESDPANQVPIMPATSEFLLLNRVAELLGRGYEFGSRSGLDWSTSGVSSYIEQLPTF